MRRLAVSVSLASLLLAVPTAHAQRVDPGRDDEPVPGLPGEDEQTLLAAAGPGARVRRDDEGHIRLLWGARIPSRTGDPARDALAFAQRFASPLGIPTGADLRVERTDAWHGLTIVRLRRFANGRPVIGGQVIARFLADGSLETVLASPGPARVEGGTAISAARASEVARGLAPGFRVVEATEPTPAALAMPDAIVPIWSVDLHGASPSQRARALLDARDGSPLAIVPLVQHHLGRVYETNPTSTMGETIEVELVDLPPEATELTGTYFDVQSCAVRADGRCGGARFATADEDGSFLFDPDPTDFEDGFAEVNVYHHLSRAAAYHRERNGFTWTCAGSPRMRILANYTEAPGVPFDNAAFSPASGGQCGYLLFGQGSTNDFAYDADVVAHEFGHAVTDQVATLIGFLTDGLGVSYEPLAVNEGTSDYYAAALHGDPEIAESLGSLGGIDGDGTGSLRSIGGELSCPTSLFGEGHSDGRLWGGLGWQLRGLIGPDATDALVFTTVASITEDPTLAETAELLVATADAMVAAGTLTEEQAEAVRGAVEARGLADCRRIVPLDDGGPRRGWSGNEFMTGLLGHGIVPLHYRIEIPADATSLSLSVTSLTLSGAYTLHLREGAPVRVQPRRITADATLPVSGRRPITLDASSEYPLPRCTTLYVAIEATDLQTRGQSLYTIEATLERSGDASAECPAPEPDAGVPSGDGGVSDGGEMPTSGGGGCGCRTGGRSAPGGALAAVLGLGLAILGRRRRRG